jgi:galacturonosyltransferase
MMYQNPYERDTLNTILGNKVRYIDIPGSGINLEKYLFSDYPSCDKGIIFNYVARIVRIKGINEYLACARISKAKYPNTPFRIFGQYDDNSYKDLIEEARKEGYIEYMGAQSDMLPFIKDCHAVIHPSYYEGMTNVVLEHSAVGRVCIASDIPGCKEGIEEGKTGYLFRKKDIDDLVNVVEKFVLLPYDKKKEMGKAARKKMEREFDRKIVTETYIKEIKRIIS